MSTTPWSDDDLRRHVLSTGGMFAALDAAAAERTAECTRQMTRIVPAVQRRLLESTGAVTSPEGVAILAAEVIDRSPDPRRYWLVASTTPWQHLEEWVGDELVRMYKRAAKRGKDKEALAGIEAASTRRELE